MALKPIRARLRNVSNDIVRVQLTVPAGEEIEVSAEVAAEVAAQRVPLVEASTPDEVTDPDDGDASEPATPAKKAPAKKAAPKRGKATA